MNKTEHDKNFWDKLFTKEWSSLTGKTILSIEYTADLKEIQFTFTDGTTAYAGADVLGKAYLFDGTE